MVEIRARLVEGPSRLAADRYALLARVARLCAARGVSLVAFGLGVGQLRLVVATDLSVAKGLLRALRIGLTMSEEGRRGLSLSLTMVRAISARGVEAAVVRAHALGVGEQPLRSPWTSHRDLLGYRDGGLIDVDAARAAVDPKRVHALLAGDPLPEVPAGVAAPPRPLARLLRLAAGVLALLPSDPKCFRLFTHLARACGYATRAIADALCLTPRRVRQLAAAPEPRFALAWVALHDARLGVVP